MIISSVGYQPLEISIKKLESSSGDIGLRPSTILLNEVAVKPIEFKTKTSGRTSRSAFMSTKMISERNHVSDELGKEIGTVIAIDKKCQLKNFNMFVIFNHLKYIKFRLNIYDVKGDLSDKLIIKDDITFDVNEGKQKLVSVYLEKYNIYLTGKEKIAVTVQWLESQLGADLQRSFNIAAIHSSKHSILFRDKTQSK